jgi:hypothetical protein
VTTKELLAETWLDRQEQWDALVRRVRKAGVCGLDTEFYNVDPAKESCVGRAKIHVWSIAVRTSRLLPFGFHHCRSWVLPASALDYPPIRELLADESLRKEIHNQPVDVHALANRGVVIRGGRNTLDFVRWTHPGLINVKGRFKLKALMLSLLYRAPVCTFKQLVTYKKTVTVWSEKKVTKKVCACGVAGCRLRKGHPKTEQTSVERVSKEKEVDDVYPLESIVPGHPRFELLLAYAADDAVAALQIAEVCDAAADPAPWPFGGERPKFSQDDTDVTIEMETVGIPVDIPWCRKTAEIAMWDEQKELAWLFRWFYVNAPWVGPWRRWNSHTTTKRGKPKLLKNGIDAIWSSTVKLLKLFDALGFPRSPIWKKGKVKEGKAKLDGTAMEWIAKNYPDASQVIRHLLELKKIRSQKKYLDKLRDSGGIVHPICGPAGDDDDRSGAVTGRKAIKGEFEAQQLPTKEEKDKYNVRKAVVAWPVLG